MYYKDPVFKNLSKKYQDFHLHVCIDRYTYMYDMHIYIKVLFQNLNKNWEAGRASKCRSRFEFSERDANDDESSSLAVDLVLSETLFDIYEQLQVECGGISPIK